MVVLLHNIRSAHNVGSIFRTADAVGIEKIYCCGITPAPLDRFGRFRKDFAKVALGAEKIVPWESCASTALLLGLLKRSGYTIFAVEQASGSISVLRFGLETFWRPNLELIALVFGDEVKGLSSPILKLADRILEIPMFGKKESLNVSVAFGIVAYRLREFRN